MIPNRRFPIEKNKVDQKKTVCERRFTSKNSCAERSQLYCETRYEFRSCDDAPHGPRCFRT